MEIYIDSKRIYEGKILNLRVDTIEVSKNGRRATREVVEHRNAVAILARDAEGKFLLVKQYRYPVQTDLIEIPAGIMEEGENPLESAQRELREETGYSARTWTAMPPIFSSPGFSDEKLFIFIAEGLEWDPLNPDYDEDISLIRATEEELLSLMKSTDTQDAKTLAAIGMYFALKR